MNTQSFQSFQKLSYLVSTQIISVVLAQIFLLSSFLIPVLSRAAPAIDMPTKTASMSSAANWDLQQSISQGYLLSFNSEEGHRNELLLTALESHTDVPVRLRIDLSTPIISGATVVSENRLAVVGAYTPMRTEEEGRITHWFLAYSDFNGQISKLIDLGNYAPNQVCSTSDGNVWVLGQDMQKETSIWAAKNEPAMIDSEADYNLLRNYSSQGVLIRSAFKRSLVRSPSAIFTAIAGTAMMTCGAESVGIYMDLSWNTPNQGSSAPTWTEYQLSDQSMKIWTVQNAPPMARATGLGLPYANTPFASLTSTHIVGHTAERTAGLYNLVLGNDGLAKWVVNTVRNDGTSEPAVDPLKMLGVADDALIYVNGTTYDNNKTPVLAWSGAHRAATIESVGGGNSKISPDTSTPPPTTVAGDVQHYVDWADGILKKINTLTAHSYAPLCYTTACGVAMSKIFLTNSAWNASKGKASRTVAFAVATKTALVSEMTALNSALAAQPIPAVPPPGGGGGGGGGGGCGHVTPPSSTSQNMPSSPNCYAPMEPSDFGMNLIPVEYQESSPYLAPIGTEGASQNEFMRVGITCEQSCDTSWHTVIGGSCGVAVIVLSKSAFQLAIGGFACLIAAQWGYLNCVQSKCGPTLASSCKDSSNYYAMYKHPFGNKQRAAYWRPVRQRRYNLKSLVLQI